MSPNVLKNVFPLNRYHYVLLGTGISSLLIIGLFWLLLMSGAESPGRTQRLVGRMHPVIVHLPIGILLAVFLYEISIMFFPDLQNQPIRLFLIWIGFLSAVASSFAGMYLSLTGGYDASYLSWHKWLGMFVALFSGVCFVLAGLEYLNQQYRSMARRYRRMYRTCLLFMTAALLITGHLGGTLTHGPGYVTEYLPTSVRSAFNFDRTTPSRNDRRFQNIQKAAVYDDLVKPVLQKRCVSCHGPSKKKGDLRLDTEKAIKKGGENGKIIQPGKPKKSELVRRITLPPYHEQVMPPDNEEPLPIGETELIRWWIATGASFDGTVSDVRSDQIPSAVQTTFDRRSAPPEPDLLDIYETKVGPAKPSRVTSLNRSMPWDVSYLSEKKHFLNVRVNPDHNSKITRSAMNKLKPVRKQVAWLDLRGQTLTDNAWTFLEQLPLLHRLHVQNSNIRDRHLKPLSSSAYLIFLNLHHTDITDAGLGHLNYDALERMIVWQTDVSDEKINEIKASHSDLHIEQGATELDQTYKSLSYQASVSASNVFKGQTDQHGAAKAVDGNPNTRWATDGDARDPWIKIDLGKPKTIVEIEIDEAYGQRIQSHTLEYRKGEKWKPIYKGKTVGHNYETSFDPVKAQVVRLNIHDATNGPTIHEIRLHGPKE